MNLTILFLVIGFIILLGLVVNIADSLLQIKAKEVGIKDNMSIIPNRDELYGEQAPAEANKNNFVALKKGFDMKLKGAADKVIDENIKAATFAVKPTDFIGMSPIPKVMVEVGDKVNAGDVLFFDKKRPDIKYCSPVSGEVAAVNRGEKRSIAEVVVVADGEQTYRKLDGVNLETCTREELTTFLQESGAWAMLRQRPFELVADPADTPKTIYISTFDTAPLAPDLNFVMEGKGAAFQKGLDVLNKLSSSVELGLNAGGEVSEVFTNATGVKFHWFKGLHPAGNVGIQLHHVNPINKGDIVWTLDVQAVATIGALFTEGCYKAERVVALTGAELEETKYVNTYVGANVGNFVKNNLKNDHVRYVSGDVLSGTQITKDGFMSFYDDQLTVLEEKDEHEMFGWLLPLSSRPSISNTFPNGLFPGLTYRANTNTHGERRAFVVTGQYEQVLPMDIYPQHLLKNIMMRDFDMMEGLGIYELAPEDLALCEFVCTSKQPVQALLRDGLEYVREQG